MSSVVCDMCDICNKPILDTDNSCDFCHVAYCDSCMPDDISFHKCDTCNTKWCYFNGRYADYQCLKIKIHSGSCYDCGL